MNSKTLPNFGIRVESKGFGVKPKTGFDVDVEFSEHSK